MFVKAQRKRAKARIGLVGPAGSGKTFSALLLAFGLVPNGRIALIDTEHGSGSLYAELGDFDVLEISAPFTTEKYIQGIKAAEAAGYDCLIIDSLSHAWAGSGGLLEFVDNRSATANKFAAWRDATPKHNALVEAMLQSPIHIIATLRSKTEYVVEQDAKGRAVPRKVGLAPVQREGLDYEFTLVFDLEQDKHHSTASKDRTSLFGEFCGQLSEEHGRRLKEWLEAGTGTAVPVQPTPSEPVPPPEVTQQVPPTPNRQASTQKARNLQPASQRPKSLDLDDVLGALATRNIEVRFDRVSKVVFAQSYKDKEFLKALGFKWDSRTRHWLLQAA
jgi:hypothetical protein